VAGGAVNVGVGGAVVDGGADVTVAAAGNGTERGRGGGAAMRMWRRVRRVMRRSEDAVRSVVGERRRHGVERNGWSREGAWGEAERRHRRTHGRAEESTIRFFLHFILFRSRDFLKFERRPHTCVHMGLGSGSTIHRSNMLSEINCGKGSLRSPVNLTFLSRLRS
jgi:hypothetical protein